MDYQKVYEQLVARAKGRIVDCYTEQHHVMPRCLGGLDDENNIVRLTGREHLLAHLLLVQIYPTNEKLFAAAWLMSSLGRLSCKQYEWLKIRASKYHAERLKQQWEDIEFRKWQSEKTKKQWDDPEYRKRRTEFSKQMWKDSEFRKKMSSAFSQRNKKRWENPAYREKMSAKRSEETKKKMSIARLGSKNPNWGKTCSEETRRKISETLKKRRLNLTST